MLTSTVELVGPIPRAEILTQYAWADLFLLPSICEGSATVVYEAMAAGLPVICTPNTGSVVRNGCEGFIIPIRNSDAIADVIDRLSTDRELLFSLQKSARRRAQDYSLHAYKVRLEQAMEV